MSKLIAIDDLAHELGLLVSDVEEWILEKKVTIVVDYKNRPAVDSQLKHTISECDSYEIAIKKSISRDEEMRLKFSSNSEYYKKQRLELLVKYKMYISELESMHREHINTVNDHDFESPEAAAFLLLSKAIGCLKMGCDNLMNGYWVSGSVIREIDETIHTANYFIILKDTNKGKSVVRKWFRKNIAPKHSDCRDEISKNISNKIGLGKDYYHNNMRDLYHSKSKLVHPTFGPIREVSEFNTGDKITIESLSYGVTENQFKLYELTKHYKSSIWSVFQIFYICFSQNLPLNEATKARLIDINKEFTAWF
jgi:hypothetical protein